MILNGSFKNLPTFHKVFYMVMMFGVPVAMAGLFFILFLVVKVEEFIFLALPWIFGIVSPVMILKDILNSETIEVEGNSISMEKRFGKRAEFTFEQLRAAIGLVTDDRIVIFMISNSPVKVIAPSDWHPLQKKKDLISILKSKEENFQYEYKEFDNKQQAMEYARSFF